VVSGVACAEPGAEKISEMGEYEGARGELGRLTLITILVELRALLSRGGVLRAFLECREASSSACLRFWVAVEVRLERRGAGTAREDMLLYTRCCTGRCTGSRTGVFENVFEKTRSLLCSEPLCMSAKHVGNNREE
jgi:hypothetical protein